MTGKLVPVMVREITQNLKWNIKNGHNMKHQGLNTVDVVKSLTCSRKINYNSYKKYEINLFKVG